MRLRASIAVALAGPLGFVTVTSAAPQWGPVKATGAKSRVVSDTSVAALPFAAIGKAGTPTAKWRVPVRVPSRTTRARTVRVLRTSFPALNGGKPFPLARVTATTSFTLLQRGYTEKIFSSNFDRYWNVCVNSAKSVTAQGGDVYCTVWHPERVRLVRSTRIKNYPRPRIVSKTDLGSANPICPPGTRRSVRGSTKRAEMIQECRDGASETGADTSSAKRTVRVTARIFNGKRWIESTTEALVEAPGPGWVDIGEQPRPGPTATITEKTDHRGYWTLSGSVTNSYDESCWVEVFVKSTAGQWVAAGSASFYGPGTQTWRDYYWSESTNGIPTDEIEARPHATLCD